VRLQDHSARGMNPSGMTGVKVIGCWINILKSMTTFDFDAPLFLAMGGERQTSARSFSPCLAPHRETTA
jgi:hypothetical protein